LLWRRLTLTIYVHGSLVSSQSANLSHFLNSHNLKDASNSVFQLPHFQFGRNKWSHIFTIFSHFIRPLYDVSMQLTLTHNEEGTFFPLRNYSAYAYTKCSIQNNLHFRSYEAFYKYFQTTGTAQIELH
jgi:hypothetical protein